MLQAIRDRITGIVAIFVLGLLAVPFLFFGVESYIRAVPQDAVATVGEEEISTSEFQTSFARHRARLREQQGDAYDEIATNQPIVRREHLEEMIDRVLLRQHAEAMGLEVTDGMLFRIISDIPNFHIDGRFDPELYRQLLRGTGRTPRGFERELREDLQVNTVPSALSASAIVTEAEIDRLLAMQQEQRRVSFIEVSYDEFAEQIEVTDEDIETFYQDNLSQYMTTEQVRIAYVELHARDLTEGLDLSEDELLRRYEAASQRYLTPETRRASHILIEAGAMRSQDEARIKAGEIRERILEGESFEELAREYSDDPDSGQQGGDLGWIEPQQMVAPFEDALYGLAVAGDLSEPVETRFGWHLIRLDEVRPPEGMSFEEAREEILAEYIERESESMFIEISERMVDLVFADDSTLDPLAQELGLEIQTSEPFGRAGGSGIAANRHVVDAAYSDLVLLDGSVSDPIELDRNHMVVIKVEEHFPSEPRPLAEVAETVRERLIRERASELAEARANALAEQAGVTGEALEDVALEAELELEVVEDLGRFDFQHGPDLITALFRLPAPVDGQASVHVLPRGRNFVVVRLEEVIPGNPTTASEMERMGARQQVRFMNMNNEVAGLVEYLRDNTRIRVVEERL
jgi:peptidyl-prolyl cis-trans isomerase D